MVDYQKKGSMHFALQLSIHVIPFMLASSLSWSEMLWFHGMFFQHNNMKQAEECV